GAAGEAATGDEWVKVSIPRPADSHPVRPRRQRLIERSAAAAHRSCGLRQKAMADSILRIGEIEGIVVVNAEHALEVAAGRDYRMQIDHCGLVQAELEPIDLASPRRVVAEVAEDRDLARAVEASQNLGLVQRGAAQEAAAFQLLHLQSNIMPAATTSTRVSEI